MIQQQHRQPLKQRGVDTSLGATRKLPLPADVVAPFEQLEQPADSPIYERPAKRTRFSPTSTLIVIQPRSAQDIKRTWYDKGDISQFKRDTCKATQVLRNTRTAAKVMEALTDPSIIMGSNTSDDSRCSDQGFRYNINGLEHIRGIEHLLSQDVLSVLINQRKTNVAKILEEQEVQRNMREGDPSSVLKTVSESNSQFAKEWSQKLAKLH